MSPFFVQGYLTASLALPAWLNPWIWLPPAAVEWAAGHNAYSLPVTVSLRAPRMVPSNWRVVIGGRA